MFAAAPTWVWIVAGLALCLRYLAGYGAEGINLAEAGGYDAGETIPGAFDSLVAKLIVDRLRRRRVYKGWRRPRRFDRNLIVIGAGAGGLVTAYIAATVRAKVTLIEANRMGGDCLNTGCVPSKALIRSARAAHEMRTADFYGLEAREPAVDFKAVMRRIRTIIDVIAPAADVAGRGPPGPVAGGRGLPGVRRRHPHPLRGGAVPAGARGRDLELSLRRPGGAGVGGRRGRLGPGGGPRRRVAAGSPCPCRARPCRRRRSDPGGKARA